MAKRLTSIQKEEIKKRFLDGETIEVLSQRFECTKLTIIRNLKKILGETKFNELIENNKLSKSLIDQSKENIFSKSKINLNSGDYKENKNEYFPDSPFIEIAPLDYEIDNSKQRDLSSVPIDEVEFPKIVYMVVDKKIELEIKYLKDYSDWQFLSEDELKRKTIEIFKDLKEARRACNKEQLVIKVPNTKVFKIVAPFLVSRGISRIVSTDKLISL